jgi:hypothetical protein
MATAGVSRRSKPVAPVITFGDVKKACAWAERYQAEIGGVMGPGEEEPLLMVVARVVIELARREMAKKK